MRTSRLLLVACLVLGACAQDRKSEEIRKVAENVLTLQTGTVSELRDLRGTGPFRRYERSPDAMLDVVERAIGKARGLGGRPVRAVMVSHAYHEVVAKERTPDEAARTSYEGPFRTAVVVTVHPIDGEADACRVEIHATRRGPFHRGRVRWERDLPGWIDEVLREEAEGVAPRPDSPSGLHPLD